VSVWFVLGGGVKGGGASRKGKKDGQNDNEGRLDSNEEFDKENSTRAKLYVLGFLPLLTA
jgi:hypothetical protein